ARPDDKPPGEDASAEVHTRYEQRRQELQVRLTAQRILAAHLRPSAVDTFWPGIDLDLTGALLHGFQLTDCLIRSAEFAGARFSGDAMFDKAPWVQTIVATVRYYNTAAAECDVARRVVITETATA